MKANQDDAPEHLRNRKKRAPWRFLAVLGIGSMIFWGLAALFAKPIMLDINQIKSGIHITGTPEHEQPIQPIRQPSVASYTSPKLPTPTDAKRQRPVSQTEIDWFKDAAPRAIEKKQTSFSDDNYTPRSADNTMQPPPARYYAANLPSTPKHRVSRQTNLDNWNWENGHNRQPVGGKFQWTVVNNQIDYNSVCQNYKRGSLIYRDCRKGAKVAFKKMCSQYKPACAAENNYLP